jgi:ferredoxin
MTHDSLMTKYWNIRDCTIPVGKVTIIADYCKGGEDCEECLRLCPEKVLGRSTKPNERGFFPPVVLEEGRCTVCGRCMLYCAENAIFVEKIGERVVALEEIASEKESYS